MLTKRIIPCLDIKDGRVVKGIEFKNLRDAGDPVEAGKRYSEEGADELVFLDINASAENRKSTVDLVSRVAASVFIPFTVGGGISEIEDIKNILRAGADKVSINTAAFENPDLIKESSEEFGVQCIVCAIDARKKEEGKWEVYLRGGRQATGTDAVEWARKAADLGAGEILLTSMDADGTEDGYDIELTKAVAEAVNVPVIASGGAGNLKHLSDVIKFGKADAVLAASIFHFKQHSIKEAKLYLQKEGIPVRF